jgi:two-component system, OmpR family, response regulator QseB
MSGAAIDMKSAAMDREGVYGGRILGRERAGSAHCRALMRRNGSETPLQWFLHECGACMAREAMRILLVEDDRMIAEGVRKALRAEGFAVDWVQDGEAALTAAGGEPYDLMLLDLGLPKRDGLDVLKAMRARGLAMPVLIVTARDAVADRVKGLDAGADDYLVKPFDLDELGARMRALMRRHSGRSESMIRHGPLTLDPAAHQVTLNDAPVALSAREFALLEALLARPGAVLSKSQLEEKMYGWGEEIGSNTVEVYIHALRKKLGADLIRNVRGLGYMIAKEA